MQYFEGKGHKVKVDFFNWQVWEPNIVQLLTGDEGNIWYDGPSDQMFPSADMLGLRTKCRPRPKAEGNIWYEGPIYHILPESPVNTCFVIPSLV